MRGKSRQRPSACRIGIDLLGSDVAPIELLRAIISASTQCEAPVHLTLFGTEDLNTEALPERASFFPVSDIIHMDDDPLIAIRRKKQSSLYLGIQRVKEGHLDAFISAGNTGALMAASKLLLSPLPGVDRPALLALLPTKQAEIAVLDVGANTSYKAQHLVQFALMGVAFQKSRGISHPRVGLLNVGSEAKKGTPELRLAYEHLQEKSRQASFNFMGNIEAREVFQGGIDVLVTDGFTGNIFLKTAEGIGLVILEELEVSLKSEDLPQIHTALTRLSHHLHYSGYPGALLAGVDGIVIKCHGSATTQSILASISSAENLVKQHFLETLSEFL